MIEIQTEQARMDESSRSRERAWLSMADEKRFGVKYPIEVRVNSGKWVNKELIDSTASFDQLIHVGQNVYLQDNQFIGLITKIFLDASGHVSHLAIRTSRIFGRHKMVPIKSVRDVTPLRVQLSIDHEQFRHLSKYYSDYTLTEDVERALWKDVVLRDMDYHQIDVRVQDGMVILNGHVSTSMNQWRAETAVKSVPGILGMKSFIIPDDKLTLEVAGVLGQLENADNTKFFTKVDNGVAVLVGEVSSVSLRDQAEQCVSEIPWVRGIMNEIRVSGMVVEPEDQRFLQPLIGKEMLFKDALSVTVQQVVINPHNRRVVAVVVMGRVPAALRQGQQRDDDCEVRSPERQVVLPVRAILHLTRSAGILQIASTEATQFEDYDASRYITPAKGWLPPYPYCTNEVLFLAK